MSTVSQIRPSQRQFAGQLAWERDLKITVWPSTPRGLSALITKLRAVPPAPIADWQLDAINERIEKAVVEVPGFVAETVFTKVGLEEGEMPVDRSTANRMLRDLDTQLAAAEFAAVSEGALEAFTAPRDSDEAKAASRSELVDTSNVSDEENVPF